MSGDNQSAILYFTRSTQEEIRLKRLSHGKSVLPFLIERSRNVAKSTELPVFESIHLNLPDQSVNIQFYHALKAVFDQGFTKVIVIGNDCPQLQANDILQATSLLDSSNMVLGPDRRGGVYLFGIHKEAFREDWIVNLPWHTDRFLSAAATSTTCVSYLDMLDDVNHFAEIKKALRSSTRKNLILALIQQIDQQSFCSFKTLETSSFYLGFLALRGPPVHC